MNKYEITWDEQYQLIKLYDLLRDTGMMDDLPKEIETFFGKYGFTKQNETFFMIGEESVWKNQDKYILLGKGTLETSFCMASIGVPAAILPNTATSDPLFFKLLSSKPPLITLGEKLL